VDGEAFAEQLVFELHRAVPRVSFQAVLLEGELVGLVNVKISACFSASRHIDIIEHEHIRICSSNLQLCAGPHTIGLGLRRFFGQENVWTEEQQEASTRGQVEVRLDSLGRDGAVEIRTRLPGRQVPTLYPVEG